MTVEARIYELATMLRNAETDRDDYRKQLVETHADLRVVKTQLHIAERLLEERPDLAARYQAAISVAA